MYAEEVNPRSLLAAIALLSAPARHELTADIDHHQHLFSPAMAARAPGVDPIDADAPRRLHCGHRPA